MIVLDASVLLAYLQDEPGADEVEVELSSGASRCSAVNWSETAQKVLQRGGDWDLARSLLLSYDLMVEPVSADDAEAAAALWARRPHLSLGDRLCLALAGRLEVPALTADRAWGADENIRQLRPTDPS